MSSGFKKYFFTQKIFLVLVSLLSVCSQLYSQSPASNTRQSYDTAYIQTYPNSLTVAIPVTTPFLKFILQDLKSNKLLDFAPNRQYDLGLGINYKWFNAVLGTGVSFNNNDNHTRGKTKYTDAQVHFNFRRFANDVYYQDYKGFYVKNSKSYPGYTGSNPYEIRPDVKATLIALNTNYIFNYKEFSYRNSFGFVETQLKSAGSLLAGGYYSFCNVKGDSGLVSHSFKPSFDSSSFVKNGVAHTFGVNVGYVYTFVITKGLYATASFVQGFGLNKISYDRENETNYSGNISGALKTNVRLAFGYDSGKFFIGGMAIYDFYYFQSKSNSIFNFSNGKAQLFLGYRVSFKKRNK